MNENKKHVQQKAEQQGLLVTFTLSHPYRRSRGSATFW